MKPLQSVRAKTELFLHLLVGSFDGVFSRPYQRADATWHLWGFGPEWERQIQRLRQRALLEKVEADEARDRVYRLTELGRATVSGGVDPRARLNRQWDGTWRIVAFDLPEHRHAARETWRRELRRLKFGCLQGSVWVSPDPVEEVKAALEGAAVRTQRLLFLEGRPAGGESDEAIVQAAWNLDRLKTLHAQHRTLLRALPASNSTLESLRTRLPAWVREELASWKSLVAADPLLPRKLWPRGYAALDLLDAREKALRQAARLARRLFSSVPEEPPHP